MTWARRRGSITRARCLCSCNSFGNPFILFCIAAFIFESVNKDAVFPSDRIADRKWRRASSRSKGGGSYAVNSWRGMIFNSPL
jgi:hypothetical protein